MIAKFPLSHTCLKDNDELGEYLTHVEKLTLASNAAWVEQILAVEWCLNKLDFDSGNFPGCSRVIYSISLMSCLTYANQITMHSFIYLFIYLSINLYLSEAFIQQPLLWSCQTADITIQY